MKVQKIHLVFFLLGMNDNSTFFLTLYTYVLRDFFQNKNAAVYLESSKARIAEYEKAVSSVCTTAVSLGL